MARKASSKTESTIGSKVNIPQSHTLPTLRECCCQSC